MLISCLEVKSCLNMGGRTWVCPSLGWSSKPNRINSQEEEAYAKVRALSLDSLSLLLGEYSTVIHPPDTLICRNASQPLGSLLFSVSTLCVLCGSCSLGASIVLDGQTGDGEKGEPCSSQACLGLLDAQRIQVEKGHSLLKGAPQGWSLLVWSQFPSINKSKWWHCVKFSL